MRSDAWFVHEAIGNSLICAGAVCYVMYVVASLYSTSCSFGWCLQAISSDAPLVQSILMVVVVVVNRWFLFAKCFLHVRSWQA